MTAMYRLRWTRRQVDVPMRMESEVMESPSMMASETHRIQPAAPDCFSMGPGAQPLCLAAGPSQAQPADAYGESCTWST